METTRQDHKTLWADFFESEQSSYTDLFDSIFFKGDDKISTAMLSAEVQAGIDNKVSKAGDTMTGALTIPRGTEPGHAINKGQLDTAIAGVQQINSDWNAVTGRAQILNKPTLFDGTWSSLSGKPTLAAVALTGNYNDLTNKPANTGNTWHTGGDTLTGTGIIGDTSATGFPIDFKTKGTTRLTLLSDTGAQGQIASFAGNIVVNGIHVGRGSSQANNTNLSIGIGAGRSITTGTGSNDYQGTDNTNYGHYAGSSITTGYANNNYGYNAGYLITTGGYNNNYGVLAGFSITTGYYNNNYGGSAGYRITTGYSNNNYGVLAGFSITTGSYNNNYGYDAGCSIITGSGNLHLGNRSGYVLGDVSNTIILQAGNSHYPSQALRAMMNSSGNWGFGTTQFADIGAKLHIQNSSSSTYIQQWDNAAGTKVAWMENDGTLRAKNIPRDGSDLRLKKDIEPLALHLGLEAILKINTVEFSYKDENDKPKHLGVIAQELMKIVDNTKYAVVCGSEEETYSVNMTGLIPMLVKSIQELQAIQQHQQTTIQQLHQQILNK